MAIPATNWQITLVGGGGYQAIDQASATQMHPLGTVVRARDINYGEGEFVYLAGVASTAAGDVVCYNSKTGVTVRAVEGGATSIGALGIAMAATVAGMFGWYQISGSGPTNATTTAANTQAYLTATDGQIDDTGTTPISGLTITAATSAGFATVQLDRPSITASSGGGGSGLFASTVHAPGFAPAGVASTTQGVDVSTGNTYVRTTNPGQVNIGVDADNIRCTTGVVRFDAVPTLSILFAASDSSGTPGPATIDKTSGRSALAATSGAAGVEFSSSPVVGATSRVFITPRAIDATAPLFTAVCAAGKFTVTTYSAAGVATNVGGTWAFDWFVINGA